MGNHESGKWARSSLAVANDSQRKVIGRQGEDAAVRYLQEQGWKILARNWRCSQGELDVIAQDHQTIVFIEVKTRTSHFSGHPLESISAAKVRRLRILATHWLAQQTLYWPHLRIDAIALDWIDGNATNLEHIQGVE